MKKSALIVVLFLLMQVVCGGAALLLSNMDALLAGVPLGAHPSPPAPQWTGIALLCGNVLLIVLLWAVGLVRRRPLPAGGLRRVPGWGLALPAMVSLALAESLLLAPFGLDDGGMMVRYAAMLRHPLCLLLLVVAGPVCEEFVFREGVLRQLVEAGQPVWRAVLFSALLFAVVHGNPAQAVPALVAGLLFGLFYAATGDMRLCTVAHILNNSLAVALLAFPGVEEALCALPAGLTLCAGLFLTAVAALLLYLWWRRTKGLRRLC